MHNLSTRAIAPSSMPNELNLFCDKISISICSELMSEDVPMGYSPGIILHNISNMRRDCRCKSSSIHSARRAVKKGTATAEERDAVRMRAKVLIG